jgi:gliding motility-associated-like protein
MCTMFKYFKLIYLVVLYVTFFEHLSAQNCIADYFSISYKGTRQQFITKAIINTQSELLTAGYLDYYEQGQIFNDGWIVKYSAQGSILWSKRYKSASHNHVVFKDIVTLPDGSLLVAGYTHKYINTSGQITQAGGVLFNIDNYGNILWAKTLNDFQFQSGQYGVTYIENIVPVRGGDFIVNAVYHQNSPLGKTLILKMDAKGNIKWATGISSNSLEFDFNLHKAMIQLANGNLLMAGFVVDLTTRPGFIAKAGYYILALDPATGERIWDNGLIYHDKPSLQLPFEAPVQQIIELPNGDLSFWTSVSDSAGFKFEPFTQKSANIITDASGNLRKTICYYNTKPGGRTMDVHKAGNNGDQVALMYDGNKPVLMQTNYEGKIIWQKAYGNTGDDIKPISLINTVTGNYIFANSRASNYGNTLLIKTSNNADDSCTRSPVNIVQENIEGLFKVQNQGMQVNSNLFDTLFSLSAYSSNYFIEPVINCFKACCRDLPGATQNISVCEGETFTLPDNKIVKDSGTYYTTYKTSGGCDSIVFYHLSVIKNPKYFSLGADDCLEGKDSVTLKATPGFTSYTWMNTITGDSVYKVYQPGIYWASVSNRCGVKKDSAEVFQKCEFFIFMPTAFTPNGDGLNDVFRIPPSVSRNRLISLTIFNRWGKVIFQTNAAAVGWNGTYNNKRQPAGTYTYFLLMEGLNGRKIKQKGIISLLR